MHSIFQGTLYILSEAYNSMQSNMKKSEHNHKDTTYN